MLHIGIGKYCYVRVLYMLRYSVMLVHLDLVYQHAAYLCMDWMDSVVSMEPRLPFPQLNPTDH